MNKMPGPNLNRPWRRAWRLFWAKIRKAWMALPHKREERQELWRERSTLARIENWSDATTQRVGQIDRKLGRDSGYRYTPEQNRYREKVASEIVEEVLKKLRAEKEGLS